MAKGKSSYSEMSNARQSDGINVIFDKNSPASSLSSSGSSVSCASYSSSDSEHYRGRSSHRRPCRGSSSSSSNSSSSTNRSSSRSRSRSHPRCHRPSSRCCCDNHLNYGRGRYPRSPPRRHRAQSRSYSRSPSQDKYSCHRRYRSRSRSLSRSIRYRRAVSRFGCKSFKPSSRTYRSQSRSRSSGSSVSLSLDDKRELLKAAKANAMKILGVENLDLPESVQPILSEQSESKWVSPVPKTRVIQHPKKTLSQNTEEEPDDVLSPKLSPKGKISFSINNSVVKPTVVASSCAKVTPRVDSYESRKPYGHWVPVKAGRIFNARKRTLAKSH
uniref:arginine/serine-rich protein 1 n=1 Tax=Semicossyphus pulcher TaxID=241346 RepID=UPI0037E76E42